MAKRPNAIKYTQFFNSLHDICEDYIESQETEGKRQSIEALMKMIERDENLILYGPVGTGKTHLVTAIEVAVCLNNMKVKFFTTAALVIAKHTFTVKFIFCK